MHAWETQRLPTAYLLVGLSGIGKASLVCAWFKWVNCQHQNACDACNNCQLFNHQQHPDFLVLKPAKNFIQIQQIQELKQSLNLPAKYAKKRVVLVKNATKMNLEAANAFLKTLEEPPQDSLIFLTLEEPSGLLPTIRSRCQALFFEPLTTADLTQVLNQYKPLNPTELEFLLRFSGGRINKAWVENLTEVIHMHELALQQLMQLSQNNISEVLTNLDLRSIEKQHLAWTEFFLNALVDLVKLNYNRQAKIMNQPWRSELLKIKAQHPAKLWLKANDNLLQTALAIQHFSNKGLAIEAFLLGLHRLLHSKA